MSYPEDNELGYNIDLHNYEGGGGEHETFVKRIFNRTGKDKHERTFRSSAIIQLACFVVAAVMLIIFSCLLSDFKEERQVLVNNDIGMDSFVNWRMVLYKAELVVCPIVMLTSKIKRYNVLMIGWLLYCVVWFMSIFNCINGYNALHNINFTQMKNLHHNKNFEEFTTLLEWMIWIKLGPYILWLVLLVF